MNFDGDTNIQSIVRAKAADESLTGVESDTLQRLETSESCGPMKACSQSPADFFLSEITSVLISPIHEVTLSFKRPEILVALVAYPIRNSQCSFQTKFRSARRILEISLFCSMILITLQAHLNYFNVCDNSPETICIQSHHFIPLFSIFPLWNQHLSIGSGNCALA